MKPRQHGLLMIISGAALWGISGPMIQWLFQHTELSSLEFLVVRLLAAGIIILGALVLAKKDIFGIWRHPRYWLQLIIFGTLGMLGAQYAFIEAVYISNAVTATLFQFLGPVLITIYVAAQLRKLPSIMQLLAIFGALIGVFFLVTNGSMENVVLSRAAIIMGLLTAIGFAFYTLQPKALITDWGTLVIIGWGMLIGGIVLYLFSPQFSFRKFGEALTVSTTVMLILIIIVGTLSFLLYIGSLKYLSATESSLLSSIEPLVAAIVSIIWLKESFGAFQLMGGLFIVAAVVLLSLPEKQVKEGVAMERAS
ncbi:DMT family transporter [Bacillus sp. DTU_2020_1000418_1_SI_GHA_SEK_038]|uniref:DMT family transporter n=1 Tax=Bacillus sp. DTU_2020_1000418_1_SI_GHA_SEK_038 TaxID=3077585 RepID=UPI0028E5C3DC|nr:DMT family transporter [Bacillus sp. DTU_2020_1000418_1_SI_GHA_SEK_038]WNS76614.1 DMT family transporter [Bacillus sp. DTU_2020_1000418_1_SI_GHA_SEK_038]